MSTTLFFGILVLLTIGIWIVVMISLWYGRELLKRQKQLTQLLLPYLRQVDTEQKMMKSLHISKDEPIEKYREITLPDQVHVVFSGEKNSE